jgi:hypothetical protein
MYPRRHVHASASHPRPGLCEPEPQRIPRRAGGGPAAPGPSGLGCRAVQAAYLYDLDAEQLQPEQQSRECCLVRERAMQHRLDRLHCGCQPFEIDERFGREDSRNAYLVIPPCHRLSFNVA